MFSLSVFFTGLCIGRHGACLCLLFFRLCMEAQLSRDSAVLSLESYSVTCQSNSSLVANSFATLGGLGKHLYPSADQRARTTSHFIWNSPFNEPCHICSFTSTLLLSCQHKTSVYIYINKTEYQAYSKNIWRDFVSEGSPQSFFLCSTDFARLLSTSSAKRLLVHSFPSQKDCLENFITKLQYWY